MKGMLLRGTTKIPNHGAPNHQFTISYHCTVDIDHLGIICIIHLGPQQPMETWRFFVPSKYGCTKQRLKMKETWVPRVFLKTRIFSFLPPEKLPNLRWIFCSSTRGLLWRGFQVEHIATFSQLRRSHHWWDSRTFLGWLILMGSIMGKYFIYIYIYIHMTYIHMIYILFIYFFIQNYIYIYTSYGSYGFCILGFVLYWWFLTDSAIVRDHHHVSPPFGRIPLREN